MSPNSQMTVRVHDWDGGRGGTCCGHWVKPVSAYNVRACLVPDCVCVMLACTVLAAAMRAERDRDTAEQRMRVAVDALSALQVEHQALVARSKGMVEGDPTSRPGPQAITRSLQGLSAAGSSKGPTWIGSGIGLTDGTRDGSVISDLPGGGMTGSLLDRDSAVSATMQALLSTHRRTLRRLVHVHCCATSVGTAPQPPSHLLTPAPPSGRSIWWPGSPPPVCVGNRRPSIVCLYVSVCGCTEKSRVSASDAVADGDDVLSSVSGSSIPIAALLFGTDMYGNPATSTRAAEPSYGAAAVGRAVAAAVSGSSRLPPSERGEDLDDVRQLGLLDLSGLGLTDDDVAALVFTLCRLPLGPSKGAGMAVPGGPNSTALALNNMHVPGSIDAPRPILALDLRCNRITDVGAVLLARLVGGTTTTPELGGLPHVCCRLRLVDLRANNVTSVGVGALVDSLKSNKILGVQHVYVSSEGLVRALGPKPKSSAAALAAATVPGLSTGSLGGGGSMSTTGAPGIAAPVGIVAIVDARENSGVSVGDPRSAAVELLGKMDAAFGAVVASGAVSPVSALLAPFRVESIDTAVLPSSNRAPTEVDPVMAAQRHQVQQLQFQQATMGHSYAPSQSLMSAFPGDGAEGFGGGGGSLKSSSQRTVTFAPPVEPAYSLPPTLQGYGGATGGLYPGVGAAGPAVYGLPPVFSTGVMYNPAVSPSSSVLPPSLPPPPPMQTGAYGSEFSGAFPQGSGITSSGSSSTGRWAALTGPGSSSSHTDHLLALAAADEVLGSLRLSGDAPTNGSAKGKAGRSKRASDTRPGSGNRAGSAGHSRRSDAVAPEGNQEPTSGVPAGDATVASTATKRSAKAGARAEMQARINASPYAAPVLPTIPPKSR